MEGDKQEARQIHTTSLRRHPYAFLGVRRDARVSELAKAEDEDVLSRSAGVQQTCASSLPPVLKLHIVELLEILGDDKRDMPVLEAFLQCPPCDWSCR